ncbi:MAG TPA: UDP-glucose 4-epimerase GalE [Mycobacteriales bacterium]|nr:UDP-glucose 4-epimerase GalE [Mycobacteriales bacterium]
MPELQSSPTKVLLTGGAGYIGSTTASACRDAGIIPVILDSLVTGRAEFTAGHIFYPGDIADGALLDRIFAEHPEISAVLNFAARIVVPESVAQPMLYYRENVSKTQALLEHLDRLGCSTFVFSSSASMYAPGEDFSVDESSPLAPQNPYARTKMVVELMLRDIAATTPLNALSLRYFNPIGADPLFRTGLQSRHPTHALGRLIQASQTDRKFTITGNDWPTRDGTGIRDYVNVWDLALAHVAALQRFDAAREDESYGVINLGTGEGTTVRELVTAFGSVTGLSLDIAETGPRPGDSAGCFTRSDRATKLLGWRPTQSLEDGIRQSVEWADRRRSMLGY